MPVTIALYNLVVVKAAVEERYPGGSLRFRADFGFDATQERDQEDNELLRIAAMDPDDLMEPLELLRERGLRHDPDAPANDDMVIIARYGNSTERPVWLRWNALYAWHAECAPTVRELAERITTLTVDEFIDLRERGELPVGSFG